MQQSAIFIVRVALLVVVHACMIACVRQWNHCRCVHRTHAERRQTKCAVAHWRLHSVTDQGMESLRGAHASGALPWPPEEWLPQLVQSVFFEPCPLHARTNSRTKTLNYFSIKNRVPQCGKCEVSSGDRIVQVCTCLTIASALPSSLCLRLL